MNDFRKIWLSDKALTRGFLRFLVPLAVLIAIVEYVFYSSLAVLVSIIIVTTVASAALAHL